MLDVLVFGWTLVLVAERMRVVAVIPAHHSFPALVPGPRSLGTLVGALADWRIGGLADWRIGGLADEQTVIGGEGGPRLRQVVCGIAARVQRSTGGHGLVRPAHQLAHGVSAGATAGGGELEGGTHLRHLRHRGRQAQMQDAGKLAGAVVEPQCRALAEQALAEGLPGRGPRAAAAPVAPGRGEGHGKRLVQQQRDGVAEVRDDLLAGVPARMFWS